MAFFPPTRGEFVCTTLGFTPALCPQVMLLSVEMTTLKEERDRLRGAAEDKETSEQLLQAIRDRDEAIAK